MKIGMQFAMPAELHALPGARDLEPFEIVSGVPLYRVAEDIIACAGGIGKVNAAMSAEVLCLHCGVDMIVNAGVAGCATDLPTGSLVVPSEFLQHDMDTTAIGDPAGHVSTVDRLTFPTWKPERCRALLRELCDRARWIRDTFDPLLLEMEGCAVAQVCLRNNVPFVALKSVSDHLFAENQVEEYFDFGQALENLGRVLLPFVLALQKEAL